MQTDNKPSGPPSGEIVFDRRINIVSLANLGALVALLFTAIGTWYGLLARVDTLNVRVDTLTTELARTRADTVAMRQAAESDVREMRSKVENMTVRASVVETQVGSILATVNRMEQKLEARSNTNNNGNPVR
jgi:chaperonin cofactor prefoldin